jgi:hypothetical protein
MVLATLGLKSWSCSETERERQRERERERERESTTDQRLFQSEQSDPKFIFSHLLQSIFCHRLRSVSQCIDIREILV